MKPPPRSATRRLLSVTQPVLPGALSITPRHCITHPHAGWPLPRGVVFQPRLRRPQRCALQRINYFAFALERACSVAIGLLNRLLLQLHARFFFNNPTFPADGAARQKLGKLVARPRIKSIARRAAVLAELAPCRVTVTSGHARHSRA